MAERSGFFNAQETSAGVYDRTYNADDFSRLYRKTIGNGVLFDDTINNVINSDGEVNGELVDDLKVSASGNNIIIAEGTAILQGYWYNNDAELQVITGVTPSENFMIALVLDITTREIKAKKTTWTSGTPVVPEGNENNYVLPLATVTVSSSGVITVTDVRQFVTNSMKVVNEINNSLIGKVNLLEHSINEFREEMSLMTERTVDVVYPVGSIFITTTNKNPQQIMPFTQWKSFGAGRVLVGVDPSQTEFNTVEKTGGAKTVTLTVNQMPSHQHSYTSGDIYVGEDYNEDGSFYGGDGHLVNGATTGSTGGGQAHNNLQPYITVYMWKRTR